MKTKTFDCVEMKRRGAEQVREQTARLTLDEQLAFWDRRTRELLHRQRTRSTSGPAPPPSDPHSRV